MRKVEQYNSKYPLAYYEVGKIYSFYGQTTNVGIKPATQLQINRYSSLLLEFVEEKDNDDNNEMNSVEREDRIGNKSKLNRYYAVVVDKINEKQAKIVVMFLNCHHGKETYLTKSYAVNYGCSTDGKNLMSASVTTDFSGFSASKKMIGGITRSSIDTNIKKTGGVTRLNKKAEVVSSSIGGITKIKQERYEKEKEQSNEQRVGGITRIKK